jgi:hypothetical protein
MEVLLKRMSKYGLTVHPEKSRLVRFAPPEPADSGTADRERPEPRTFDFLGFTHDWGGARKGGWAVKRRTAKGRLQRALHAPSAWRRPHRREPIDHQHRKLRRKLQGRYGCYGITGNFAGLQAFLDGVRRIWRRWLLRRRRGGPLSWSDFLRLERSRPLPRTRVVHRLSRRAANS